MLETTVASIFTNTAPDAEDILQIIVSNMIAVVVSGEKHFSKEVMSHLVSAYNMATAENGEFLLTADKAEELFNNAALAQYRKTFSDVSEDSNTAPKFYDFGIQDVLPYDCWYRPKFLYDFGKFTGEIQARREKEIEVWAEREAANLEGDN